MRIKPEIRKRKFNEKPYATNPMWHLLGVSKDILEQTDWNERSQAEFVLAIERASRKKLPLKNREQLLRSFVNCVKAANNYDDITKNYNEEILEGLAKFGIPGLSDNMKGGFSNGDRFQYKNQDRVNLVRDNAVTAYADFRKELETSYNPKRFALLAKKLNLPPNISESFFRFMVTGSTKVDRMDKIFIVDEKSDNPKIMISSNASRNELDDALTNVKKQQLLLPKSKKNPKPYPSKHSDGFTYVAVDLAKGKISKLRLLWPQIQKLQSKLFGYEWKQTRKKKNVQRDIRLLRGRTKKISYGKIAATLSNQYSPDDSEGLSKESLRQAYHRIKKRTS